LIIFRKFVLILLTVLILLYLAIQTDLVQNALVKYATGKLSNSLGVEVRINKVSFSLFSKVSMEGTLIRDQQKDTLLYAGSLKVNITDWFFLKR
jgi:hypothetical protein